MSDDDKPQCRVCERCHQPFVVRDDRQRFCDLDCFVGTDMQKKLRAHDKRLRGGYRVRVRGLESRRMQGADLASRRWGEL